MNTNFKNILLTILFIIFFGSIGIDVIVVQTMSDTYTEKYVTGYILDDIILDNNLEDLDDVCNHIKDSKNIDKITYKFLRTISFNIVNDCYKNLRIDNYLKDIIEKDLANISDSKKIYLINNFNTKYFQNTCDRVTDSLNNGWKNSRIIVILYSIFSSFAFRFVILSLILLIIIKSKYKICKKVCNVGISLLGTSVAFGFFSIILKLLEWKILELALGRAGGIRIHDFGIMVIVIFIISILLLIVSKVINKENSKINEN